jgi:hypothetical protein
MPRSSKKSPRQRARVNERAPRPSAKAGKKRPEGKGNLARRADWFERRHGAAPSTTSQRIAPSEAGETPEPDEEA